MEATPGFEPGVEVLQTSALPLGDGASRRALKKLAAREGPLVQAITKPLGDLPARGAEWALGAPRSGARVSGGGTPEENWSGKRDSNPRLRPWQGRTLPLSYSRPQDQSTTRTVRLSTAARCSQ